MEYWWNDSRNPAFQESKEPELIDADILCDTIHIMYNNHGGHYMESAIELEKIVDYNDDFDNAEVFDFTRDFDCTIRVYLSNGNYKDYFTNLYEML